MRFISLVLAILAFLVAPLTAQENKEERFDYGGDVYVGAERPEVSGNIANDVFATGYKPITSGTVNGDVHTAGFEVIVDATVAGNTYAFGNMVRINGVTGKDVTSSGSSVRIDGEVGGNVRAAGADVTINAPVLGSVLIGAASFDLNANVQGDVNFSGDAINFGEGAKVDGKLIIRSTRDNIEVPTSVASADRVTIEKNLTTRHGDERRRRGETNHARARYCVGFRHAIAVDFADCRHNLASPVPQTQPNRLRSGYLQTLQVFVFLACWASQCLLG